MPYNGPDRLKLLVLITKYNQHHPKDKIKPQLSQTLTAYDAQLVDEYIAQEAALRSQYPYNDFQKQAQKLQPLLEEVMNLTYFTSYEEVKWMELLVVVNDMLKQKERQQKEIQKAKTRAEKKVSELRLKMDEHKKAEKDNSKQAVKAEQENVHLLQQNQQSNKLQKKPNPLACPVELIQPKEKKKGEKKVAEGRLSPLLQLKSLSQNVVEIGHESQMQVLEANHQQVPGQFPVSVPPLPPRKASLTEDLTNSTTPSVRPAFADRSRSRSSEDAKKRVAFNNPDEDHPKPKEEDTIMTGTKTPTMPGAWQESMQPILSVPAVDPEEILPEEKAPARKKGKEPEKHQAKMDRAHYDALRVASEINKFSWPGVKGK
ncbi:hypothetical protein BKA65DRAFT_474001 [Rhexocercosporidium sp. MPI-PUGE-AT-0058]|nr:hypothetical protein BKA65DRAFT_474001 [Rhexocercosporidium sp. MPI-PUGE-AT-0058]